MVETEGQTLALFARIGRILTCYGLTHGRTGWYEGELLEGRPPSATIPILERRCVILARRAAP